MEYVYAVSDGMVLNNVSGGTVMLHRGEVWFADDPFVQARSDLFSTTPVVVHSTAGQPSPEPTPAVVARKGRRG